MNSLPNLIPVALAATARTAGARPNPAINNAFDDVMSAQQSRSQASRTPERATERTERTAGSTRDDRPPASVRGRDPQDRRDTPDPSVTPPGRDDASRDARSIRDHGDAGRDDRRDDHFDAAAGSDDAAGVAGAQAVAAAGQGGSAAAPAADSATAADDAGQHGISGIIGRAGITGVAGSAASTAGAGAAAGQPIVPGQLGTTGPAGGVLAGLTIAGGGSLGGATGAAAGASAGPAGTGNVAGAGAGATPVQAGPADAGGPIGQLGGGPGSATGSSALSGLHLGQLGEAGQTGPGPSSATSGWSPGQAAPGQPSGPGSATGAPSGVPVPDPSGSTATGVSLTLSAGQWVSTSTATNGLAPGVPIDPNAAGQLPVIAPVPPSATAATVQAGTGTVPLAGIGLSRPGARAGGDLDTGSGGASPLNPGVNGGVSQPAGTVAPAAAIQPPASANQAQPVITQVMDHLVKQQLITARNLHDGTHHAVIRLNPGTLGHVTVTMDVRAGQVRIDLAAGSHALAALGGDLGQLRSQLTDAGLNLADVTLSSQTADSGAGQPAPRRDDGQPAAARTSPSPDQPMTDRGIRTGSGRPIGERGGLAAPGSLDLLA